MFLEYIMLQLLCGYNLCNGNNVPRVYNVEANVWLHFMAQLVLFAMINILVLPYQQFPK